MKTKIEIGNGVVLLRDGNMHATESVEVKVDIDAQIQTHITEHGWEVWFIDLSGKNSGYCIASSTNPPDRHYDE